MKQERGKAAPTAEEEFREYQRWLDEPVPVALYVRLWGGMHREILPPAGLTVEAAVIAWAAGAVRDYPHGGRLRFSRRDEVVLDREGRVTARVRIGPDDPPSAWYWELMKRGHVTALPVGGGRRESRQH